MLRKLLEMMRLWRRLRGVGKMNGNKKAKIFSLAFRAREAGIPDYDSILLRQNLIVNTFLENIFSLA